jgi:hypothetical protein
MTFLSGESGETIAGIEHFVRGWRARLSAMSSWPAIDEKTLGLMRQSAKVARKLN